MELYRVFPWNPRSGDTEPGGPFFVARDKQGRGRHDVPLLDGVYYCSQQPVSAVSELLQGFRSQSLTEAHFERPDGLFMAIVGFKLDASANLLNLDDPEILTRLKIRPSRVLTGNRDTTRAMAERIYRDGAEGMLWPSALEASWVNATLFESRVRRKLSIVRAVKRLSLSAAEVIESAAFLHINF